jgi:hypothetical protein
MPKQLVMDRTGHSEHVFDRANEVKLKEAMERFDDLVNKQKFAAAVRTGPGELQKVTSFDPNAEETVFVPPLQGG